MLDEPVALKVVNKINRKLKFIYGKNVYLRKELGSNALIQPHFDYPSPACYPNPDKKKWEKIQTMQNKCIRFCLKLDKMPDISRKEFRLINWLHVNKRVDQCINTITYNFVNSTYFYISEWNFWIRHTLQDIQYNYAKLKNPFCKTNMGQKSISYIGHSIWNSLSNSTKRANSLNTFKYNVKKHYLSWMINKVYTCKHVSVCICVYV